MLIGVSLKMYFSHARTVAWVSEVAEILAQHPAAASTTAFVMPQHPSIPACLERGGALLVGAQDAAAEDAGAFTKHQVLDEQLTLAPRCVRRGIVASVPAEIAGVTLFGHRLLLLLQLGHPSPGCHASGRLWSQ